MISFYKMLVMSYLVPSLALSSTFVGNGGNAKDLELNISLKVISQTLDVIKPDIKSELCLCPDSLSSYPVCRSLEKLTKKQIEFCQNFLVENASEISSRIKKTTQFVWTENSIYVKEKGQNLSVDAITEFKENRITIQKNRFIALPSYERNFLISHEIFHLSTWNKKPIQDEQIIGPFNSETGGRELLNAAAASIVVLSNSKRIAQQHVSDLNRSRKNKKYWIQLDYSGFKAQEDLDTLYIPEDYRGYVFTGKYYFTEEAGFFAKMAHYSAEKTTLDTIKTSDSQNLFGIGGVYRFSPSTNEMSFWGQSYIEGALSFDFLTSEFKLDEDPLHVQEKASSNFLTVQCTYFMPLEHDLWLQAGLGYNSPRYSLNKEVDAEYSKGRLITNLGVSYAF
ncbi:MAG: hypothetical protein A2622_12635 [Bdellovibrionales bacterium RIFCSPHIGHO2_01_FULL_40_29]|nr:MAG: hypothetical protein A2622_12635 [Bdellovibrionales bacterium RIFCSPHIGHO2_01_FULL_40_29]OFZ33459.1 MAG: hypothetical protein A3D17_14250 [Bdellovibrionales bacterium RIFCSPHIGHO2_02_FULL_40_15]